jgi:hypothetical protein
MMRTMRAVALASIGAVGLLGAFAGPAAADIRFEGRTSQGGYALLVAEDDGVPKRGLIRWRADCRRPGFRIRESTVFSRPLDLSTRRRFRDVGSYRENSGGRYRITYKLRTSGRKVGPRRWVGSFRARAVVRRGGRVWDRCSVRGVRWRVSR